MCSVPVSRSCGSRSQAQAEATTAISVPAPRRPAPPRPASAGHVRGRGGQDEQAVPDRTAGQGRPVSCSRVRCAVHSPICPVFISAGPAGLVPFPVGAEAEPRGQGGQGRGQGGQPLQVGPQHLNRGRSARAPAPSPARPLTSSVLRRSASVPAGIIYARPDVVTDVPDHAPTTGRRPRRRSGRRSRCTSERPWGRFTQYCLNEPTTVKIIEVKAGSELSLQRHRHRAELWVPLDPTLQVEVDGRVWQPAVDEPVWIPAGATHRLSAPGERGGRILEVGFGHFDEGTSSASPTATGGSELRPTAPLVRRARLRAGA